MNDINYFLKDNFQKTVYSILRLKINSVKWTVFKYFWYKLDQMNDINYFLKDNFQETVYSILRLKINSIKWIVFKYF